MNFVITINVYTNQLTSSESLQILMNIYFVLLILLLKTYKSSIGDYTEQHLPLRIAGPHQHLYVTKF